MQHAAAPSAAADGAFSAIASVSPVLRSPVASLSGLLAALLLPVSLLSVWVHGVVSDTDKYVETVTPLADDDAVKAAAVKELQREALQLAATTGTPLLPGTDAARPPGRAAGGGQPDVPHRVGAGQPLRARAAGRRARGPQRRRLDDEGRVSIQLATVFGAIAQNLADQGLVDADRAADIDASFAVMDADQLAKARRAYDTLDALGFWLPLVWAALVLLTLLLAQRRLATTAKLAAASLLTLGLLALVLLFARDALTGDLPQRDVALAVWDVVVASLWRAIGVSAAALAGGRAGGGGAGRGAQTKSSAARNGSGRRALVRTSSPWNPKRRHLGDGRVDPLRQPDDVDAR